MMFVLDVHSFNKIHQWDKKLPVKYESMWEYYDSKITFKQERCFIYKGKGKWLYSTNICRFHLVK